MPDIAYTHLFFRVSASRWRPDAAQFQGGCSQGKRLFGMVGAPREAHWGALGDCLFLARLSIKDAMLDYV